MTYYGEHPDLEQNLVPSSSSSFVREPYSRRLQINRQNYLYRHKEYADDLDGAESSVTQYVGKFESLEKH